MWVVIFIFLSWIQLNIVNLSNYYLSKDLNATFYSQLHKLGHEYLYNNIRQAFDKSCINHIFLFSQIIMYSKLHQLFAQAQVRHIFSNFTLTKFKYLILTATVDKIWRISVSENLVNLFKLKRMLSLTIDSLVPWTLRVNLRVKQHLNSIKILANISKYNRKNYICGSLIFMITWTAAYEWSRINGVRDADNLSYSIDVI